MCHVTSDVSATARSVRLATVRSVWLVRSNANCVNERLCNAIMLIGYVRVSTDDQETAAQEFALKQAGCEKIFPEIASGGRWGRPELARMRDQLRAHDVLVSA